MPPLVLLAVAMLAPDAGPQQTQPPVVAPEKAAPDAAAAGPVPEAATLPRTIADPGPTDGLAPPAEVVVTARPRGDPLSKVNERSFAATQAVDRAITGPAALAYKRVVPDPVRSGLRNFLNNFHEPDIALNYLLQLKPGKAAETLGRFALNTTIGVAGLFDIARRKPFRLAPRPNGFGDTLGYYGVRPGAYLFLPLVGPTTVRDFIGGSVDRVLTASFIRGPFGGRAYLLATGAVRLLDRRAETDGQLRAVRDSADPYQSRRALYLHKRQAEIDRLHARHPAVPASDLPTGDGVDAAPPVPTPS